MNKLTCSYFKSLINIVVTLFVIVSPKISFAISLEEAIYSLQDHPAHLQYVQNIIAQKYATKSALADMFPKTGFVTYFNRTKVNRESTLLDQQTRDTLRGVGMNLNDSTISDGIGNESGLAFYIRQLLYGFSVIAYNVKSNKQMEKYEEFRLKDQDIDLITSGIQVYALTYQYRHQMIYENRIIEQIKLLEKLSQKALLVRDIDVYTVSQIKLRKLDASKKMLLKLRELNYLSMVFEDIFKTEPDNLLMPAININPILNSEPITTKTLEVPKLLAYQSLVNSYNLLSKAQKRQMLPAIYAEASYKLDNSNVANSQSDYESTTVSIKLEWELPANKHFADARKTRALAESFKYELQQESLKLRKLIFQTFHDVKFRHEKGKALLASIQEQKKIVGLVAKERTMSTKTDRDVIESKIRLYQMKIDNIQNEAAKLVSYYKFLSLQGKIDFDYFKPIDQDSSLNTVGLKDHSLSTEN